MCDKIKWRQSYVYNLAAIFIAYKAPVSYTHLSKPGRLSGFCTMNQEEIIRECKPFTGIVIPQHVTVFTPYCNDLYHRM